MVSWIAPDVMDELSELRQTSKEFGLPLQSLFSAVENGKMEVLSDDLWHKLDNTDSLRATTDAGAKRIAKKNRKDFDYINEAFLNNQELPAPIVLVMPDHAPYLITGNTRLLAAKAGNETPSVWMTEINFVEDNKLTW